MTPAPAEPPAEPTTAGPAPAREPSATGQVHLDIDEHVAVLTLDRPARLNALTGQMTESLAGHVAALNNDTDVRAVVLTGTGRAFCAGSDIAELDRYPTPWQFGARQDYGDVLRTLRKPVIAAVNTCWPRSTRPPDPAGTAKARAPAASWAARASR